MDFIQIIIPLIEIIVITVLLNYLLSFFWNTRAMDVVIGFLAFLLLFAAASWLHLPVLKKLMLNIVNVVVLAVFIIFQPEIRMAFSRLLTVKGRRYNTINNFDYFLDGLVSSVYRFSEKRVGALILLENQMSLDEFANKAVLLNANFSSELLETIFMGNTPLHDGAVILRGMNLVAAAAILPLANDTTQLARSMGTRHRAGLGVSQITDTLSIVVSEETGKVSIAREGIITRGVKRDRFRGIIRSIYNPPKIEKSWKLLSFFNR
jgi:diadenylate cyclase